MREDTLQFAESGSPVISTFPKAPDADLAREAAGEILSGFDLHYKVFRQHSVLAKDCYQRSDWRAARGANSERIRSYDNRVREAVRSVKERFPETGTDTLWPEIKRAYAALLFEHHQPECAETFFNSVACGVLHRRYYNNEYIFFRPAISTEYLEGDESIYRCDYPDQSTLADTLRQIMSGLGLSNPFQDLERDVGYLMRAIQERFPNLGELSQNFQIHTLTAPFFRNKAAYIVGRAINGETTCPFVVPLLQDRSGAIFVDTILFDPKSIGRVFSLARAYFMVNMEVPAAYVRFLASIIPTKSAAEIYTMLGLQKQGKTLFYRDLQQHLTHSTDSFVLAPGQRGMVMLVFTLPSFPYVFKVIRDWFDPPKDTDRNTVREKYLLVKHHDRVGRMSDTLEYSNVAFPIARLSQALRDEFARLCPSTVEQDGDNLVISHLYIERRMTPLDMYLQTANEKQIHDAIDEFGRTIKELTAVNIFPGDLPLKNFGVTRYGKVVFYDYDELDYLTNYTFRALPTASSHDDEMSAEPWFMVGPRDLFPQEFPKFLFRDDHTREIFMKLHGDLATVEYWVERQRIVREEREESVYPYAQSLRFRKRFGTPKQQ